jgi:hypothetical protein
VRLLDVSVDQETLEGLDDALKSFVWNHDRTMGNVWKEAKTVQGLIESAVYYWEQKVDDCEEALRYCEEAVSQHGGGDCSREANALEEALNELRDARAAQEQLAKAEWLMEDAEKRYRDYLEHDVYRARTFLQRKAEIVERYRSSRTPDSSASRDSFEKTVVGAASTAVGAVALGAALAVIATKEIRRRRQGIGHSPATGVQEVAALLSDGRFAPAPLPDTRQGPDRFAAVYAEPAAGLLLASRTVSVSATKDADVRALVQADPDSTYQVAVVADPSSPEDRRLFARGEDGAWMEILPDELEQDEEAEDAGQEVPDLPELPE